MAMYCESGNASQDMNGFISKTPPFSCEPRNNWKYGCNGTLPNPDLKKTNRAACPCKAFKAGKAAHAD
jgi:hypothetical protein